MIRLQTNFVHLAGAALAAVSMLTSCAPQSSNFHPSEKNYFEPEPAPAANNTPEVPEEVYAAKKAEHEAIRAAARRHDSAAHHRDEGAGAARADELAKEDLANLIDASELTETNGQLLKRPIDIDAHGYQSARLTGETWSGNIWSQYRGHSAWRYNVKSAHDVKSWAEAWDFITQPGHSLLDVFTSSPDWRMEAGTLDDLSPAEKYDLLIGDPNESQNGFLSKAEWKRGQDRQSSDGSVATWYGYCHGWAPASFSVPRPAHSIEVPSFDGHRQIKFYPDDIKALATVLWANALPELRLVGERCEVRKPKTDENGRIIDDACRDVNPATFHLALVNQLGVIKRNLIIDATYDVQIWNQPIVSYKYKYFNPQTKKVSSRFQSAVLPLGKFTKDKFSKYRSSATKSVVGVLLEIEYGKSVAPSHIETDSAEIDRHQTEKYSYDLEINDAGEIVGGEWYQIKHPDFIWVPAKNARPLTSFEDAATGEWGAQGVPAAWRGPAANAAAQNLPLAKIVDALVKAASLQQ